MKVGMYINVIAWVNIMLMYIIGIFGFIVFMAQSSELVISFIGIPTDERKSMNPEPPE